MIPSLSLLAALAASPALALGDESTDAPPARIAWYGTWESALAEARASGRPIFLQSAAPQCHGVPGLW